MTLKEKPLRRACESETAPLILREIVTIAGDHSSRWEQVFSVLDEAVHGNIEQQGAEAVHTVRPGLDGRAN